MNVQLMCGRYVYYELYIECILFCCVIMCKDYVSRLEAYSDISISFIVTVCNNAI